MDATENAHKEDLKASPPKKKDTKKALKLAQKELEARDKQIQELEKALSTATEQLIDFGKMKKRAEEYETKIGSIRDYVKKMEGETKLAQERIQKESSKAADNKLKNVFCDLLEVIDNFDRSMGTAEEESGPFVDGVRMIYEQFNSVLKRLGLEKIKTEKTVFDPTFHEALTMAPTPTDDLDGKIMEEIKAGYTYKDILIRPAQVIVGKKSD